MSEPFPPRLAFVFRTDVHTSEHSPESWKADYPAEIWNSLEQIGELAREFGATAVLDGGDFFHVKAPTQNSHRLVAKIALLHQVYPCPVYCIEGNHDIKHNNLETLSDQPLGVLYNAGVFHHLRDQTFHDGDLKVRVVGVPYSPFRTLADLQSIRKRGNEVLIAIVHALAGRDPPAMVEEFFGEPVFRYEQLIVDGGPDIFCYPPGTPVLDCLYRPIPIEKVFEGQRMLGRNQLTTVEVVHPARHVSEDLVRLDIEGVPPLALGVTADHPYWVATGLQCTLPSRSLRRCHPDRQRASQPCKGCHRIPLVHADWIKAGQIKRGDYVATPVPEVPADATPEPGLARLLGYYAAEGHALLNRAREPIAGIGWSFHSNETDLHEDVQVLVERHFGLRIHYHYPPEGLGVQLCAYGPEIAKFLIDHAGRFAESKSLSSWIWERPIGDRWEFLDGWLLGDGHARSSKTEVMGGTVSPDLAYQVFFLSLSMGLRPYYTVRPARTSWIRNAEGQKKPVFGRYPLHVISFYGDDAEVLSKRLRVNPPERTKTKVSGFFSEGLYFARVREVARRPYEGVVHNFRTSTGEYVAGGVLVHNCFGHWHQDQGVVQIADRWFVNQGAVSRGSLSRENLGRTPKVSLIEVTPEGINVATRELRVAPAADVFNLERKERQDRESKCIEQYVERIQQGLKVDDQASVDVAISRLDFAREIHDLALSYLQQIRQQRLKAS